MNDNEMNLLIARQNLEFAKWHVTEALKRIRDAKIEDDEEASRIELAAEETLDRLLEYGF